MRFVVAIAAVLLLAVGMSTVPVPSAAALTGSSIVAAQEQQPTPKAEVDINIHRTGGAWWASPTWIAIGAIALVLLAVIIALVTRSGGGGTTIIRE